jgi:hypothetical protein
MFSEHYSIYHMIYLNINLLTVQQLSQGGGKKTQILLYVKVKSDNLHKNMFKN